MNEDTDPFACFDESSDDGDSDAGKSLEGRNASEHVGSSDQSQRRRCREENNNEGTKRYSGNGVLAFHEGTELALLHHIRTELAKPTIPGKDRYRSSSRDGDHDGDTRADDAIQASIDSAQTVLDLVDSYCMSRHWMMHVGPEKAQPLRRFITDCLIRKEKTSNATGDGNAFTLVELGTYCGYSSIFTAKTVMDCWRAQAASGDLSEASDGGLPFHIYSVEVVEKFATVAKELIRLAGMEAYISIILMKDHYESNDADRTVDAKQASSLSSELKRTMISSAGCEEGGSTSIDFLFVDHDKSLYLPHLRELEDAMLIRKGTHVAADNVVFAEIHDYRRYMTDLADKGIVTTRLEDSLFVEYCQPELTQLSSSQGNLTGGTIGKDDEKNPSNNTATRDMLRDGIEFSIYLQDPR